MQATSLDLNVLIYKIFSKKINTSNTYLMGDYDRQTSYQVLSTVPDQRWELAILSYLQAGHLRKADFHRTHIPHEKGRSRLCPLQRPGPGSSSGQWTGWRMAKKQRCCSQRTACPTPRSLLGHLQTQRGLQGKRGACAQPLPSPRWR